MSTAKNATEVLIATKWILENIGWHQKPAYLDKNGMSISQPKAVAEGISSCCLIGACHLVEADEQGLNYEAQDWLCKLITPASISEWNDRKGRTKEQVLSLLTCAIRKSAK